MYHLSLPCLTGNSINWVHRRVAIGFSDGGYTHQSHLPSASLTRESGSITPEKSVGFHFAAGEFYFCEQEGCFLVGSFVVETFENAI